MHVSCLLAAILLFNFTGAFVVWSPPYLCLKEGTCQAEKRSIGSGVEASTTVEGNGGIVKLDIFRRRAKSSRSSFNAHDQVDARDRRLVDNTLSPRATVTAQAPMQTNSVGVDQDGGNNQYFIQAHFGNNATPLLMLMDTGGFETWVVSSDCTLPSCTRHKSFGIANSKTIQLDTQDVFTITYGSGYVSGSYSSDTISIANLNFRNEIGLANNVSSSVGQYDFDGILGLAVGNNKSFLSALVASKQLTSNIFAVHLASIEDGPNDGEITFGGTDASKYTGDIKYTAVAPNSGGLWAVPLDNLAVGDKQLGSALNGATAIIDTGTTNIFASSQQAQSFFSLISGSAQVTGGYTVPCDTTTPILVTISGATYSIPASDWIGPMANGVCFSNIGVMALPGKAGWLLGDMWLRQVYTVFDVDNSRVGIAMAKTSISMTSSTMGTSTATGTGPTGSITLTSFAPNLTATGSSSQASGSASSPGSVNAQSTLTVGSAASQTTSANTSAAQKNSAVVGNKNLAASLALMAVVILGASAS